MHAPTRNQLISDMEERYGPMMGGNALYSALGFRRYAAFHRCKEKGEIGVSVFALPGRRGWFALTRDVASWLVSQASDAESQN